MNILYSLQHPAIQSLRGRRMDRRGSARTSYLDEDFGGPENDFTNRNTTFMTWNILHLARLMKDVRISRTSATGGSIIEDTRGTSCAPQSRNTARDRFRRGPQRRHTASSRRNRSHPFDT